MRSAKRNLIRLAAVGLCFALAACSRSAPPPGGATGSKAERARRAAEALAMQSVDGAATSQVRAVPELAVKRGWFGGWVAIDDSKHISIGRPKPLPPKDGPPPAPAAAVVKPAPAAVARPGSPPLAVREHVVSALPHATAAEADADAMERACEVVEKRLAELDPPVRHKVSVNEVRTEFLRQDSRAVRPPNADDPQEREVLALDDKDGPRMVYVEFDVEVTADQVRELRAQERVGAAVRVLGVLTAVALTGFLFLRLDEWTRGYLTSWLALGAVALAGGAAAALIFV